MAINDLEVSYEGYVNVWDSYPLQGIAHNCGLMHKPFTHWNARNYGGKVQVEKSFYFMRKFALEVQRNPAQNISPSHEKSCFFFVQ